MTRDEAVNVVARRLLSRGVADADWEDYPDIGEDDWGAIYRRAAQLASDGAGKEYTAAYWYLAARCDTTPHDAEETA